MTDITFDLVFDDGHTKTTTFNPDQLKLRTLAKIETAQKSGNWSDLIPAIADMLKLTTDETNELTIAQFREITQAMSGAVSVPNASAPPSDAR